jgi:hypothetical protein
MPTIEQPNGTSRSVMFEAFLKTQPQQAYDQEISTPVWISPAHEEIDLRTVTHEDLGLDPYNYEDSLVRKIYEAQADPYPNVPAELKQHSRWVTWSGDPKQKQPFISGTNTPARTNNDEHLVSYDQAVKNVRNGLGYPHLGFVPDRPFVGLDFDSCRNPETGNIQAWATEVLGLLPATYVEITPSRTGLRAWVKIPHIDKKQVYRIKPELAAVASKSPAAELLVSNYGTITGERYNNTPAVVAEVNEQQWVNVEKMLAGYAPAIPDRQSTGNNNNIPLDIKQIVQTITAQDGDIESVLNMLPDVNEGGRDNFLTSVLGKLHQSGWTQENVLAAAERINQDKCHPPIKDPERIAKSVCRYEVVEAPPVVFTMTNPRLRLRAAK